MENIININVNGQFISKSGKNAGGAGSGNSAALRITFGSEWDAFTKRIIWRDARGENETSVLLSAGLTEEAAYTTAIPPEALKYTGWCSFTLEGYYSEFPQQAVHSISDKLFVSYAEGAEDCAELTPPESMQLHEEFEQLLPSVKSLLEGTEQKLEKELEQNSVWENFNEEKLYCPGNKVLYGGSSYLCKKETIGTLPGNGDCWQLIASRGIRGLRGLQGPRGIRGDKGDTGDKGEKGNDGEKGEKGEKGDTGERGPCGTVVPSNGFYSFSVDDSGNLIVSYPDAATKPQAELNENGELLQHCGPWPISVAREKPTIGYPLAFNHPGAVEAEAKHGEMTLCRFDGDNGEYSLLLGNAKGVDGPYTKGTYVWVEVENLKRLEDKIVCGPYIHHCVGIHKNVVPVLYEACKYIGVKPDLYDPIEEEVKAYLRGE